MSTAEVALDLKRVKTWFYLLEPDAEVWGRPREGVWAELAGHMDKARSKP